MSSIQSGIPATVSSPGFPVAPTPVPVGEKPLSQVERVVDTFVAPSKTFRDILRSASWWLPMVLFILSSLTAAFVVDKKVGYDRVTENALQASPKQADALNTLPPDQKAQRIAMQVNITRISTYAASVFLLLAFLIYSLMVWGLFNFVLGASTKLSQVFAVTLYAALPFLLLTVIMAVTLFAGGDPEAFDSRNPVGTNLGYYLPTLAPWLRTALSFLDVIKIWSLVLNVLGMAIVAKKSMTQSALIVGGLFLLGAVLAVGSVAAFT